MRKSACLVFVMLLATYFVVAQDEPVQVTLEGYLVNVITKEDGTQEEEFVEATEARPGQVIEYRVIVTNVSDEAIPANNASVIGPVQATTTYLADSATASSGEALLEFSADNKATFAEKPLIEKENAEGEKELVEALPEEYTDTRWTILVPLEPQQTLTFTYRVTVK
jgi:uncharacterized repeat protein (TIGR01451 family)